MSKRRVSLCFRLILAALFSLSLAQIAAAQTTKKPDDSETLQALLTEVRSLRLALQTLQRMSLDTYRSQLLVDRIRLSHEDVRRLTTSLNEARDLIAKTQSAIPQSTARNSWKARRNSRLIRKSAHNLSSKPGAPKSQPKCTKPSLVRSMNASCN